MIEVTYLQAYLYIALLLLFIATQMVIYATKDEPIPISIYVAIAFMCLFWMITVTVVFIRNLIKGFEL